MTPTNLQLQNLFLGDSVENKLKLTRYTRTLPFNDLVKLLTEPILRSMKTAVQKLCGKKVKFLAFRKISTHESIVLDFITSSEKKLKKMQKNQGVSQDIKDVISSYFTSNSKVTMGVLLTENRINIFFNLIQELKDKLDPSSVGTPSTKVKGSEIPKTSGSDQDSLGTLEEDNDRERAEISEESKESEKLAIEAMWNSLNSINDEVNLLLKKVNKLESTMKKAFKIFLNVISFGIYFAFLNKEKTNLLEKLKIYENEEMDLITNWTQRDKVPQSIAEGELELEGGAPARVEEKSEVEEVGHLDDSSYLAPEGSKALVNLYLEVISRNTLIHLTNKKFSYAGESETLKSEENIRMLQGNYYMFMVQGLNEGLINGTVKVFKSAFNGKKLNYFDPKKIGLNATTAVPQMFLIGNDSMARDFFLAREAKLSNFEGCNLLVKKKYQDILDQAAYFNVEEDMDNYFRAVATPLIDMVVGKFTKARIGEVVTQMMVGGMVTKEMVGVKITKDMVKECEVYDKGVEEVTEAMIQAGADLLQACLKKVNDVLGGEGDDKAAALERVRVGRIRLDETKDAGE